MITTTLAVLALAGGLGSGVIPSTPSWHTDYAQAMNRSSAEGKPMAVFIGHGDGRITKMLADGTISSESAKVLATSYICVYLDADTPTGKDLAERFQMGQGLIISNRGGTLQAYRCGGELNGTDLKASLARFAEATQLATTETAGNGVSWSSNNTVIVGGTPNLSYPSTYSPSPTRYVYPSGGYSYPQFNSYPAVNCTGFK